MLKTEDKVRFWSTETGIQPQIGTIRTIGTVHGTSYADISPDAQPEKHIYLFEKSAWGFEQIHGPFYTDTRERGLIVAHIITNSMGRKPSIMCYFHTMDEMHQIVKDQYGDTSQYIDNTHFAMEALKNGILYKDIFPAPLREKELR